MKKYILKKQLVTGYKISPLFKDTLFASIPFEAGDEGVVVYNNDDARTFYGKASTTIDFPDKYGRGNTYTLHYYRWDSGVPDAKQKEIVFE